MIGKYIAVATPNEVGRILADINKKFAAEELE